MNSTSLVTTTTLAATPSFPAKSSTKLPSSVRFPPRHPISTPKFSESDAFPRSLPLHSKHPHAIYADIQRLARLGKLREALSILDYLEHRGIPVNPTTFSSLISACSRRHNLTLGRQIHIHITINGLHTNEFLLTKLVEMYASCGSPDDAKNLFSHLPIKTVYPWNALLKGNIVGGRRWGHGPLSVFIAMREAGVDANEYTFSCLLKSFAGSPAFTQGMKAHALLIKNGFVGAPVLLKTSLIDMYCKCGKVRMALKVFDEIPERDIVAWGAVIAGFAHNGLRREALEYTRWMVNDGIEPNSVIVTTILPVIGELPNRTLGREVHGYVIKRFRDCEKLVSIQSGLIDMYCKSGDMVSGRRVFYGVTKRNEVLWTALMSGYASNGRFEQALRSIVWMQQEGIEPDAVSIATALPVCAELKSLKQGKEIHGFALKHWFLPNVSIATSLMTVYAICGELEYSCRVFDGMPKKNVIAWTALMDSYLKNGRPHDAVDIFRSMRSGKQRPDSVALARILSTAGDLGALKLGKEIYGQLYKMKLESVPFVAAAVVSMYGECGDIENAQKVFDRIPSKGSLTWTAIIEAYRRNGRYREALHLFDYMLFKGFIPNRFAFNSALTICQQAGLLDEALRIYDSMVRKYDIKPSEENYICIIGLLNHAGRFDEEQRFANLRSLLVQL